MTSWLRLVGVALVLAGVTMGTAHDRDPVREIPRVGGRFVIAGDFHVHAFVGDGGLAPWELAREARRRDLDVIAVTNHNQRLAARLAAAALRTPSPGDPIVIVGQEVTAPTFHMVAAAISETIDWRLGPGAAIRAAHAQGGVAIAAHATPGSWRTDDPDALALLDGAEVAHPGALSSADARRDLRKFFDTASSRNPSLAPIGSSDFHFGGLLGLCRTYLFVDEISEAGILDAIREARTVAYDGVGRFSGDPERVRSVQALIERQPPRVRADQVSRLAAWIALSGLLVLLLFR